MGLNTTAPSYTAGQTLNAAQLNALQDGIQAAWTAWTPTLTNITLGNGTQVARYQRIGKNIWFYWDLTLGSTSAVGTGPTVSLPVTALSAAAVRRLTCGYVDTSASRYDAGATYNESTTVVSLGNGASPLAAITATVPFTWATGDILHCHGTYEAA